MLTFLFWNIQKKPLLHRVARIAQANAVDVVILAECVQSDAELLAELNAGGTSRYKCPRKQNGRFRMASTLPKSRIPEVFNDDSNRLTVHELLFPAKLSLLLGVVHLPSPAERGWELLASRNSFAQSVAGELRGLEQARSNARTVLVGDYNLSPFDDGIVSVFGFHAFLTRDLARRRDQRVVKSHVGPSFFNPMWQFMTDRGSRPAGTLYLSESIPINHYWYTPDQVLVRPEILDKLDDVQILETDGTETLLDSQHGWPDTATGSDHLPLLFRIDW